MTDEETVIYTARLLPGAYDAIREQVAEVARDEGLSDREAYIDEVAAELLLEAERYPEFLGVDYEMRSYLTRSRNPEFVRLVRGRHYTVTRD